MWRKRVRMEGWASLFLWEVERAGDTPLFQQIYLQMRSAILSRRLRPGAKLPSTRELASRLSVARTSVVSAYEQLLAEGYVCGRIGSGTYISSDLPEPIERNPPRHAKPAQGRTRHIGARAPFIDDCVESTAQSDQRPFNTGRTLVDARTIETWRKLSQREFRTLRPCHLGYSDPRGLIELRREICEYLQAARAVRCDPTQVIVTAGTQQTIDIAIRVLLNSGDQVWMEDPGYPLTRYALAAAGLDIAHIPADAQGMDIGAGIKSAPKARAVIVTPSHQYPTGAVLSMARRLKLLAWARERDAWIIEDDYASEYRYSGRPLASLQGLDDRDRVLYMGSFNKTLFPGLRIGYAVVPPSLLKTFIDARYVIDRQPPSLTQAILAEFMREGHFAAHIRRTRLLYREQRDALVSTLGQQVGANVEIQIPDQGMHLVVGLRGDISDVDVERAAREQKVIVRAMSRMYMIAPPRSALMLGFSGFPRQTIVPAAARLARVIRNAHVRSL